MSHNPEPSTIRRGLSLLAALVASIPFTASAESVAFKADFNGSTNSVKINPAVITPTGATWNGMWNKASGALAVDTYGITLSSTTSSTSAAIELAGRVTQGPISLANTGDFIEVSGQVYVAGIQNFAVGLFNSGGVDPLVTRPVDGVAMLNNGLAAVAGQVATGGTTGWKGYRAMSLNAAVTADFKARAAQNAGSPYGAWELLTMGTGGFATPGATNAATSVNSPAGVTVGWSAETGLTAYDFVYRIQRSAGDALALTFTVTNHDTSTVMYSSSGTASSTSAPSLFTSTFDAIAIGGRVRAAPYIQVTALKLTASNADITKITVQPTGKNIPTGGSDSLSVTATGTGTLAYQWYKDSAAIVGATSATYNIAAASGADAGSYYVVASNAYGSETSSTVTVASSGLSAPSFATQPTAQNVDAGSTLTLTTAVGGAPTPTYQWLHDNVEIPGATSAIYTVTASAASDAGNYKLVATNSQGTATSDTVAVTINTAAPVITVQPAPTTTVNVGTAINLSVTATGLAPPTFQWYKDTVLIPGATSSSYSVPNSTTADAGTHSYTVTASNSVSTATSDPAAVTINIVNPTFTTQPPAALTINSGERMLINAAYAGSGPLSYQWYKNSTLIPGATGSSYTIAAASGTDAGSYHVVVTNAGGNLTSIDTVVTVQNATETSVFATNFSTDTLNNATTPITSNSTSWFVLSPRAANNSSIGDDAATTSAVDPRLLLTWNTTSSSSTVETAARFAATPVALSTTGEYIRLRATFKSTNLRMLAFGLYNSGGVSPVALDSSVGGSLMGTGFSDAVNGGTQNWVGYRSAMSDASSTGDASTRPAQASTTTNKGQDLVFPAGSTGSAFSEPAGVVIGLQPGLTAAAAFTANTTYTLVYTVALTASNQYTITYGLYTGATASGTPLCTTSITTSVAAALPSAVTTSFDALAIGLRNVDGTTVPTLTFTSVSVVKGAVVTSVAPAITSQPTAQSISVGASLTLTAAASGTPAPTYQWYLDDILIADATSATYSVVSASAGNAGSYKVIATNSAGSATSNSVTVAVTTPLTPFQTWSASTGLTAGVNDGLSQDPDGDGMSNLLEFALNGNPLVASASVLPVATASGGNVALTYDIQDAALASYTITPESSTNLSTWNTVVHGVGSATIVQTVVNATTSHVVVTVPSSGTRTFLRVKVAPTP